MRPVEREDLWTLERYEQERASVRTAVIAVKERHRLEVGEHIALLFENHKTVWYQVQEMLRTERIFEAEGIQHELDTYNELVPADRELTATLLIQFTDPALRDRRLPELVGIDDHVHLVASDGRRVTATFDHRQFNTERVSSVQFVRWDLGDVAISDLQKLVIDHPKMQLTAVLSDTLMAALAEDAQDDGS